MADKRKKEFFTLLEKYGKHADREMAIQNAIRNNRIVDTVMILKTFMVSKDYYRKVILQCKLKKKLRLLEGYFL